jgi:hypothetical protein
MELAVEHIGQVPEGTKVVQSSCGTRDLLCLSGGVGLTVLHRDGREPFKWTLSERRGCRDGTAGFLNASAGIGYVALEDHESDKHLAVFDTAQNWSQAFCGFVDCKFGRSSAKAVVGMRTRERGGSEVANVVVISSSGKIAILRCPGRTGTEIGDVIVPHVADLCRGRLLGVDTTVPGFCAIAKIERKHVGIHILKVDEEERGQLLKSGHGSRIDMAEPSGEASSSVSAVLWETLWAPTAPKNDAEPIGFAIQPDAAFVLYAGGTLRIFGPLGRLRNGQERESLNRWRSDSSELSSVGLDATYVADNSDVEERPQKQRRCTLRHSVKYEISLLASATGASGNDGGEESRAPGNESNINQTRRGGIVSVGGGYVMVGYGTVLSVWDGLYGVGHGFAELPDEIASICGSSSDGEVIVILASGLLLSVAVNLDEESEGLNLGSALKRQHSCLSITASQSNAVLPAKAPLHVQPVAISILKATADAGGSAPQLFENFVKAENRDEMRRVRRVLDRISTPTAKDVSDAMLKYVFGNKSTRRLRKWVSRTPALIDDVAQRPRHRLEWLPSERLAATVVARCLRELHSDHPSFLIPLIDMLGSGVVSSDFVLAVMSDLNSASVGVANDEVVPVSLTAPLVHKISCSGALEGMLLRLVDLSELDVVRMIQFGLRTLDASGVKTWMKAVSTSCGTEQEDADLFAAHRCHRLLGRCIARPVDEKQVTAALHRMPLQDVLSFLRYLKLVLTDEEMAELLCFHGDRLVRGEGTAQTGNSVSPADYRGVESWLDEPSFKGESAIKACALMGQICLDWIGRICAVHMTTLVMDERGTKMLSGLLEVVRARKVQVQCATPLVGILQHVREKQPVPTNDDPLYSVDRIHVTKFSALT